LVETKTLTAAQLRQRMARRGITQKALAQEAGDYQPHVSAIFNGKEYFGPERQARYARALDRLEREPFVARDRDWKITWRLTL
jgi:transcriptional regulator with XRE-family HTH domain